MYNRPRRAARRLPNVQERGEGTISDFGDRLRAAGLDPAQAPDFRRAVTLLTADGMPKQKAVSLLVGAAKNGEHPVRFARYVVEARRAIAEGGHAGQA